MKHRPKVTGCMDSASSLMLFLRESAFKKDRGTLYRKSLRICEEPQMDSFKNEPYEMWFLNDLVDFTE